MKLLAPPGARTRGRFLTVDTGANVIVGLIGLIMLGLLVVPLGVILRHTFSSKSLGLAGTIIHAPWFPGMVENTLLIVGLSAVLAVAIAAFLAWLIERTDAGIGRLGDSLPLVPLFLPIVAMPIGWVMLAAPSAGYLNQLLRELLPGTGIQLNIYSVPGLIFIYVLELLPFAYLPFSAAFRSLDTSMEESARVCGASPLRTFRSISLRSIGPTTVSAVLLVIVVGLAQYSAPVIIGTPANIDILSVQIVNFVRGTYPPAYDSAVLLGAAALFIVIPLLLIQRRFAGRGHFASVGGRGARNAKLRLGRFRWVARSFLILYLILTTLLPVIALVVVSLQSYWEPDLAKATWTLHNYSQVLFANAEADMAIKDSLLFGLIVGAMAVVISAVLSLYANRRGDRLSIYADATLKLPVIIPSVVLAVGFILTFSGPPLNLGGTFTILVLAYLICYIPYASIIIGAAVQQVHRSMEEAASLCGSGVLRSLWKIVVPLIIPGSFAAYALVFVRVIGDLTVSVMLGTGQTPNMGYVLLDLWQQGGTFSDVAVLSLVQTLITAPIVFLMIRLGRPRWLRARGRSKRINALTANFQDAP
jgi:iron(III) transport system permease protein